MHKNDQRILVERAVAGSDNIKAPQSGKKGPRRAACSVSVNLAESPLGWLYARGHLTARQYDAGEKLRIDYEAAQLAPSLTMRWDAAPIASVARGSHGHLEAGERQIAARQRFDEAMRAIGKDLNDIAWRVICAGEAMPNAERAMGWPSRSGKLVLALALDRLAAFYRLPRG
jgi:hypothetical protein